MAPASPGPDYVTISYHSAFGPHIHLFPTKPFDSGDNTFTPWVGAPIDADDMIGGLVDLLLPFHATTTEYDGWRAFHVDPGTGIPILQTARVLAGKVGTDATPGWFKAVQTTISFLGSGGSKGRVVLLDSVSNNSFDPILSLTGGGPSDDLMDYLSDSANGFMTRAGEQPQTFIGQFYTLNEKLRRAYHMQ